MRTFRHPTRDHGPAPTRAIDRHVGQGGRIVTACEAKTIDQACGAKRVVHVAVAIALLAVGACRHAQVQPAQPSPVNFVLTSARDIDLFLSKIAL